MIPQSRSIRGCRTLLKTRLSSFVHRLCTGWTRWAGDLALRSENERLRKRLEIVSEVARDMCVRWKILSRATAPENEVALGNPDFRIDEDAVILAGHYQIAFDQVDTLEKLSAAVYQLSFKSWVTREMLRGLMGWASARAGRNAFHPFRSQPFHPN